jgi:hypothetical protein
LRDYVYLVFVYMLSSLPFLVDYHIAVASRILTNKRSKKEKNAGIAQYLENFSEWLSHDRHKRHKRQG